MSKIKKFDGFLNEDIIHGVNSIPRPGETVSEIIIGRDDVTVKMSNGVSFVLVSYDTKELALEYNVDLDEIKKKYPLSMTAGEYTINGYEVIVRSSEDTTIMLEVSVEGEDRSRSITLEEFENNK